MHSFKSPPADMENEFLKPESTMNQETCVPSSRTFSNSSDAIFHSPVSVPLQGERDEAAVVLQKVYKSFRTRRKLADCAVLAEQRWWRLLDFAELKRSSISFFDIEKPETALSRWSRARKRAAMVGKGLSKDEKARKLALQHWLEAIDPRHRYGHNLQFYYVTWLHCDSNQPFFYWLDIGDGKEVNHERCPRSKLQQQCIKYLGPEERKLYEVVIEDGRLVNKQSGKPIETTSDAKLIFVLSTSKTLYIGQKRKGIFQHSSFLAGGATLSAGRLEAEDGVIKAVWAHSGHYLPTEENFQEFMSFLEEHNVNLTDVKKNPREEEEEEVAKTSEDLLFRGNPSEGVIPENSETESSSTLDQELPDMRNEDSNNAESSSHLPLSRLIRSLRTKIVILNILKRDNVLNISREQKHPQIHHVPSSDSISDSLSDSQSECGYETAEESFIDEEEFMVPKSNLFGEELEEDDKNPIPKEKIIKRIDSHQGMKSYQLAIHLSTKWTTGAGPRIGCLRDYPQELQYQVLEHQHMSPRKRSAPFSSSLRLSHFSIDFTNQISSDDAISPNHSRKVT